MELFQGNGQLDEDVEDILYELGNVGVGMVSTTIGSMLGVRAEIGIPVITKADMHIVEQIDKKREEHVMVYCHNREASWVQNVREAVFGQTSVCGYKNHVLYQLKLSDIFYVEQQRNQRRGQA